jgi:hypothetical protein
MRKNQTEGFVMPHLPLPPVPQTLRDMLKDYPEHIETLQADLNGVVEKPFKGTPMFEQAIWALEGASETFINEAREELKAAEASGDPVVIARAKAKRFTMGSARLNMGGMPDLFGYFQDHKEAFK